MSDNRRFHYALLASLGLHALVLLTFPEIVNTARRAASIPPQIIARLMEPEPPPAAAAPVPEPQRELPAPKKKPAKPPVVQTPSAPIVSASPASEPVPAAQLPSAPQAVPPVAAIEPLPPAPQPAPQPPAEAAERLSRDQYRLQLVDEARRHKRYPPLARENNWQGDVLVGVLVAANGRTSVSVKASSGYEVLDRQALDMFRQATRSVPVPPPLRGKEFSLELRAVFGLED